MKASGLYVVTYHFLLEESSGSSSSSAAVFMAGGLAGRIENDVFVFDKKKSIGSLPYNCQLKK